MNLKHKKYLKVGLIFGLIAYGIFLLIEVSLFFINEEKSMSGAVFYGLMIYIWVIVLFLEYTLEAKRQKRHVDAGNIEQEILDRKKIRMLERAKELKGQRLSLDRQNHLKKILPLYRKLPDSLKPKLEERILLFQEMVKFESHPKRSTEITQQTRDMVSAEACLLIIHRSPTDYLLLEYVELWSSKIPTDHGREIGGNASYRIVKLDLKYLESTVNDGEDNHNVVLHEFAHVLDFADDKIANSIPVSKDSNDYLRWKTLLDREYPKLQAAHKQRLNPVIGEYAVSDPTRAEFFTCATESFFERPVMLKKENPEIYYLLGYYYVLDPAEWIEGQ